MQAGIAEHELTAMEGVDADLAVLLAPGNHFHLGSEMFAQRLRIAGHVFVMAGGIGAGEAAGAGEQAMDLLTFDQMGHIVEGVVAVAVDRFGGIKSSLFG